MVSVGVKITDDMVRMGVKVRDDVVNVGDKVRGWHGKDWCHSQRQALRARLRATHGR